MPAFLADMFAARGARFLLLHALLIPALFALAALAVQGSGLDRQIAAALFDPASGTFPARASTPLEIFGHRFAKSAILLVWIMLFAAALATEFLRPQRGLRAVLWTTVAAMALGPAIVIALKSLNAHQCPWSLRAFGGYAEFATAWFVPAAEAGHCFPSGHAAAGFSLIAFSFAGMAIGDRRLAVAGLAVALAAGMLFSAVRMAQGAHFLSHNLWSAGIDWSAAAWIFAPLLALQPRHSIRT